MGEFNILPIVGQNKLNEVYVVGQLYVDIFELSELPDMALSNRQGYKSDDPRYEAVINMYGQRCSLIFCAKEAYIPMSRIEKRNSVN